MSPPTATAATRIGVNTSPSLQDLKSFALLITQNVGASIGPNKINRLALDFHRQMPDATGYAFFLYVANAIQLSGAQRSAALIDPDIARVIAYADPTGEAAVYNVMRSRR